MTGQRRGPSYIAQRASVIKSRLRPLELQALHVTSDRATRMVTVRWQDGPGPDEVRRNLAGERCRITLRRVASDAAILEALRRGGSYEVTKRWLATADLSDLDPWAHAAAALAAFEPQEKGTSGWAKLRRVAHTLRTVSLADMEVALRLRNDGYDGTLADLMATAVALGRP